MRRVALQTVAEANHDIINMEGNAWELLPDDKVYIDPHTGRTYSGKQGHQMKDLPSQAIEAPRVHCYGAN